MREWQITVLGQEVDLLTGNPFKSAQYTDDERDILLLRGDNIGQGFLRWENAKRWSTEKIDEIEDYLLQEDDVVLAMDRPWIEAGLKFAYLSQNDLPCLLVQRVSRLRAKEKLNQTFLRYVIQGYEFTQYIIKTQTGTAVPHISGTQIKDFKFLMPPLSEQQEVAKTLGVLDRKISNLRQQNETLEQIAQTLFKHWFVDFEFPNEEGQPYRSSGGELVRSELGEIPAGWCIGTMIDVIEVRDGTHESPKQTEKGFHLITSKHLKREGIDFESAYLISDFDYAEANKRSKVDTLDILLSMIGTVGLLYFVMEREINFAIKNIGLFKSSKNQDYSEFIFLFLTSDYGSSYLRARLSGTTQSYVTLASLREMPLMIPSEITLLGVEPR